MSSCLRMRFAPSTSFLTAMSTSSPTWRFLRSDRCMDWSCDTEMEPRERDGRKEDACRRAVRQGAPYNFIFSGNAGPEGFRMRQNRVARSDMAVNKRGELRFGDCADLRRLHRTVLENHQRRDAADSIFRRRALVLVDVQLRDLQPSR